MIYGHVRDSLPRISLKLRGADGSQITVEFILDTGFEGYLTAPTWLLARLDITPAGDQVVKLADGTRGRRPIYTVMINWDGDLIPTEIISFENEPLLGACLLANCHVDLDMRDGGEVVIET